MRKKILFLLMTLIVLSCVVLSGCSDFSFNPTGTWKMADAVYVVDGKEAARLSGEDLPYQNVRYVFEKSGTGYMKVNETRTLSFTYEYDDSTITLWMQDPKDPQKTTALTCQIKEYSSGAQAIVQQVNITGEDKDGKPYVAQQEQYWYLRE